MTELPYIGDEKWRALFSWAQRYDVEDGKVKEVMDQACPFFAYNSPSAEWHCDTVHVHSRYKFRIVCVYLVSLLEELLEHYMLFWFSLVSASSVGGRQRGLTPCLEDTYFKGLLFWEREGDGSVTPGRCLPASPTGTCRSPPLPCSPTPDSTCQDAEHHFLSASFCSSVLLLGQWGRLPVSSSACEELGNHHSVQQARSWADWKMNNSSFICNRGGHRANHSPPRLER